MSNLMVVPVVDGKVDLYNGGTGSVDFVVDLVGYYSADGTGSVYLQSGPSRLIDTAAGRAPPPRSWRRISIST